VTVIPIDDPDDPGVALYRDIRDRDRIGRDGVFVAEGEVVLRVLLSPASRFRPVSVLLAAKRVPALLPLLAQTGIAPVFSADQAVMDRIAGFPIHRGVLAVGKIGAPLSAEALLGGLASPTVVVVAFGIANHDNVGGIFRNAAAFGAGGVLLDAASCDPLYRKAIRVSVGATLTMPFARLPGDRDPLTLLADAGFDLIALSPGGGRELTDVQRSDRTAVLLGTEGPGLPAEILARVDAVRIAMAPGVDSLNVAVTSGIALHHLTLRKSPPGSHG
jgi:tRNA G18 (ribose-2'-O)-methylase SpoU